MIYRLKSLLRQAEVNRAVFFSLLGKFWGVLSGPVSLAFISLFFTPEIQGYYYTFLSLLALQTFLELSFSTVILNFSSHEWSSLRLNHKNEIEGDAQAHSRLASLFQFSFKWYLVLALLFTVGVGVGGYLFLWHKHDPQIMWQGAWCVLVVLAGLQLCLLPFQSTLEGCNQIGPMSVIRMMGSIVGTISFWVALYFKMGLWAACFSYGVNWFTQVTLIVIRYRSFFSSLLKTQGAERVSWTHEILPVQWRLAVGGVLNYFATSLFTPVMFWYHTSRMAGQMGMGWQIMGAAQAIALTWVQVYVPSFGALISQKKFAELDRLFFRITAISFGILLMLCAVGWGIVKTLYVLQHRFAERFMPPLPLALFLLTAVFFHLPQCQSAYLRAHKREPLLPVSIVSSLAISGFVWWFGKSFGLIGAGGAYLGVVALIVFPAVHMVWLSSRRKWHAG